MRNLLSLLAVLLILTSSLSAQINCIKGDCLNGYGTGIFPGGSKYVGDFRNRQPHGKGILYFSDGNKYIGHWLDSYREGEGRMIFVSGDEYLGQFVRNKFHGQGVMIYINGNRYEGAWMDNMRHGQGTLFLANGDQLSGLWERDTYKENWNPLAAAHDDNPSLRDCNQVFCVDGKGKFTYRDGSRYEGDFLNGDPEGIGIVYYAVGDRYEGGWKRHTPHGQGVMYYSTGKVVKAVWDFGKPVETLPAQQEPYVDRSAPVEHNSEVKIWAVIVGAARYNHMPQLRYTDDDAYQLYAFLKSPEGGALPDNHLRVLIDEDATRENILNAIRTVFLGADDNDVVMFYFSGHGIQGAFLPIDFDGYKNSLKHEEIKELLNNSRAKHKLVLADACHSGSLFNYKTPVHVALQKYYKAYEEANGGTALLMSSKGEEYSLEDGGLRSGVFSHFLIRGLKGEADEDRNQIVTVQELFNYVYKNVKYYTVNVQNPTLTGNYDPKMPVAVVR
jgi:hypothetical protein